jgi:fructosamine-3-kinase
LFVSFPDKDYVREHLIEVPRTHARTHAPMHKSLWWWNAALLTNSSLTLHAAVCPGPAEEGRHRRMEQLPAA